MLATKVFWLLGTAAMGAMALASAQNPKPVLPEGPGKQILQTACAECHSLDEVTKFRGYYSRENWRDIVRTMIATGATLSEAQVPILIDYLTLTFPRDFPDGEGKKILESACTGCHAAADVRRFDGSYTRKNWQDLIEVMVANGAKLSEAQAAVLADYLTVAFPKLKVP